jgi:hypothetical protein
MELKNYPLRTKKIRILDGLHQNSKSEGTNHRRLDPCPVEESNCYTSCNSVLYAHQFKQQKARNYVALSIHNMEHGKLKTRIII